MRHDLALDTDQNPTRSVPRHFAFLRAINVGGHTVPMARLRALLEAAGFANVETFIASGNVIFEARTGSTAAMERRIETTLTAALGYTVSTFVRTAAELAAIARDRPFPEAQISAAVALNVAFLASAVDAAGVKALAQRRTAIDDFHVDGREVYWLCRRKQSESTFSNAVLEKTLGRPSTIRTLNTIRKLAAKYDLREY